MSISVSGLEWAAITGLISEQYRNPEFRTSAGETLRRIVRTPLPSLAENRIKDE